MTSTSFWEDVLALMMASLRSVTALPGSNWETQDKRKRFLRVVDRYLGDFETEEAITQSGIAGRMPAVLVDFNGEDVVSTTVGRRRDKLKARFIAICCVDSVKSREDRAAIYGITQEVRNRICDRRISADVNGQPWMNPLEYSGLLQVAWKPGAYALGVKFETIYRSDYTIEIVERPPAPVIAAAPGGGATTWGYVTIAESATGVLSDASDEGRTTTGAPALGGAAGNLVTPGASAEATMQHIYRTTAPAGVSLGLIADVAAGQTFVDDGRAATTATPTDPTGTSYDRLKRLQGSFTTPASGPMIVGTDLVLP